MCICRINRFVQNIVINEFSFSYEQLQQIRQVLSDLCKKKKPGDFFPLRQIDSAAMEPWVLKCLRYRSNISIYRMVSIDGFRSESLDSCIFSALLKGNTAKIQDPVRLSLKWNFCGDHICVSEVPQKLFWKVTALSQWQIYCFTFQMTGNIQHITKQPTLVITWIFRVQISKYCP